jgi:RNA-directed DNA polymerase
MKESRSKGIANHADPESCESVREDALEALTGEEAGRAIEPRKQVKLREADAVMASGRQHRFGRYAAAERRRRGESKPETFNFLGFTHICDVTRKNRKFIVLRQTNSKRMGAKLKEIKEALRVRMHAAIPETGRWLRAVVQGYYQYRAVPRNLPAMVSFYRRSAQLWAATLTRRSHKAAIGWDRMYKIINRWLPTPHITHPYPEHRFSVTT